MAEFLLELYVAKANRAAGATTVERFSRAAAELTAEGKPVRLVRSILVPEDETCFLLVKASAVESVHETAHRAALPFEHIVETAVDTKHRSRKERQQ